MNPDILIINASPRKNGSCIKVSSDIEKILNKKGISTAVFNIYDMNIEYCNACGFCEKKGVCRIKDDMTDMYEMFDKSYGTVAISPVYFDSVPAKMKTLIDRIQAVYSSKFIVGNSIIDRDKKRYGMYIAVAGAESYSSQFSGGDITMDFFFRSINSRISRSMKMTDSDKVPYDKNKEFENTVKEQAFLYADDILDIKNGRVQKW